jgi:hypothetical protein
MYIPGPHALGVGSVLWFRERYLVHAFVTRHFEVHATLVSRDARIEENLWTLAFYKGDTVFWPISWCTGLSNG